MANVPNSIVELSDAMGVKLDGPVKWGTPLDVRCPGVYVISLATDPHSGTFALRERAPLDLNVMDQWLHRSPSLTLDGARPTVHMLAQRLASFWLPNETIVYIGKSGRPLSERIGEFYDTRLGDRCPHAGGSWIKALSVLDDLTIYWAALDAPEAKERQLLHLFGTLCSSSGARHAMPFGNLESYVLIDSVFRRIRKPHGLRNWKSS